MVHVYMESISVTYFEEIDINTLIISVLQELILFVFLIKVRVFPSSLFNLKIS